MFIAADDTDSPKWMCTTFLATELVRSLPYWDLIGLPRLVRLNPAVPWKTRGNGAICLRVGRGVGERRLVGQIGGRDVYAFARSSGEPDGDEVMTKCSAALRQWAQLDDSDPGLIVSAHQPPPELYWRAVRQMITKEEALGYLNDAMVVELNEGRGVIGAAAAMAWRPQDRTYEVLTYRRRERWGRPRDVSTEAVSRLDQRFPSTFNNYDRESNRPAIVPHTTCPVLYGIRGDSALELLAAKDSIPSEPVDRWLLFITNQGTDDHVIRQWSALLPNSSYEVEGVVEAMPRTIPGGHVLFPLRARSGQVECAAYEPSKGFRQIVRKLRPGDRIKAVGELREAPRTLNLEKLQVLDLAPYRVKVSNPTCPACGRRMKSIGAGQGFRCRECGTREAEARTMVEERDLKAGWYEPPVCSRRHLSKPLKRLWSS